MMYCWLICNSHSDIGKSSHQFGPTKAQDLSRKTTSALLPAETMASEGLNLHICLLYVIKHTQHGLLPTCSLAFLKFRIKISGRCDQLVL